MPCGVFLPPKETIPWSGVRTFNGEDVALEPTTAFWGKWRFRDKIGAVENPNTEKRDEFAPV